MKAVNESAQNQPVIASFIKPLAPQNKFSSYITSQWSGPDGFGMPNYNSQQVVQ
jgi:hypothetical protein